MIKPVNKNPGLTGIAHILVAVVFLLCISFVSQAQETPPKPVKVTTFQNLAFGAFFQGVAGGTLTIYPNGSRVVTGDIIQANLGFTYYPAIFEIEANPGSLIVIQKGPNVLLSGSNGGSMTLHVGDTDPASPFVNSTTPPGRTQIRVGATLIVGNPYANPVGAYSGTFMVTFIQQ
jgi:hypothetical protein